MDKDFIMNRLFEHMNDVGNKKIIYIALQGSQNYKGDENVYFFRKSVNFIRCSAVFSCCRGVFIV